MAPGPSRRYIVLLLLFSTIFATIFVTTFRNRPLGVREPGYQRAAAGGTVLTDATALQQTSLRGHAIAPKLGNETAKQELGRASWKLLHTMMARFPDAPTADESAALKSYIHLFQRLYPCGECAEHFGQLLDKFPPQVSSRSAAAAWACHVHNEVNRSLKKELFDCAKIGDFYDCGCAEEEEDDEGGVAEGNGKKAKSAAADKDKSWEKPEMSAEVKERISTNGRDFNVDLLIPH